MYYNEMCVYCNANDEELKGRLKKQDYHAFNCVYYNLRKLHIEMGQENSFINYKTYHEFI